MDNPADLVPARSYVNLILYGVVLLVTCALLIGKSFRSLPRLESLTAFEATVEDVYEIRGCFVSLADLFRDTVEHYEVTFIGRSARYKYWPVYPHSEVVKNLHPGERVQVWSDIPGTYTIRQLEKNGARLIAFDDLNGYLRSRRKTDLFIFTPVLLLLAALSFFAIGRLHHRFGTRSPKPELNSG